MIGEILQNFHRVMDSASAQIYKLFCCLCLRNT
jgi:hypothetical protein